MVRITVRRSDQAAVSQFLMAAAITLAGNSYYKIDTYVHELGHNFGLSHAGRINAATTEFEEYGDSSSSMGSDIAPKICYNAPQQWALGWQAHQQADGAALKPGSTVVVTLPPQHASPAAGLRIVPDWVYGARPFYLSYRLAAAQDANLYAEFNGKVNIYQMDEEKQSGWMAAVAAGGSWAPDGRFIFRGPWSAEAEQWSSKLYSSLVVRVLSSGPSGATVSICRRGGVETAASCAAGRDNDCNGKAGIEDSGCRNFIKKKSPPPSRRPPPPRKCATGFILQLLLQHAIWSLIHAACSRLADSRRVHLWTLIAGSVRRRSHAASLASRRTFLAAMGR
jgi:hypothetical protein